MKRLHPNRIVKRCSDDQVFWVLTEELERRWKIPRFWGFKKRFGVCDVYLEPNCPNRKMRERLENREMLHPPIIAIWEDGSAHFQDGRHTFVAMRDAGYTHVPIIITDEATFRNSESTGLQLERIQRAVQPWNYKRTVPNGLIEYA